MPTFGNIFTYTRFVIEGSNIIYYGLTDDDTYAVFNMINGTLQIFDDEGEGGRIRRVM
jgi:hypothetical protein